MVKKITYSPQFDAFWLMYPNKIDKAAAFKWWKRNKPDSVDLNMMLIAISKQAQEREAFAAAGLWHADWPMGSTWLNNRRWEDEIVLPAVAKKNSISDTYAKLQKEGRIPG